MYSSQEIARRAFAAYRPTNRTLMVNPNFTEVSTWLLADVRRLREPVPMKGRLSLWSVEIPDGLLLPGPG